MVDPSIPTENDTSDGIAGFALRNAHFCIVGFIALVILGLVSALLIPKDLLPATRHSAVQIISFYPGMPADEVEQTITYPYERYSGQAVGIKYQESRSLTGVSIVRNFFHANVDLSTAMSQVSSLVMSVLRKLPPGTQPPLILPFDPMASEPLALCTVAGDGKTETELQDLGRYGVLNAIQTVPGAMAPTVMGGRLRQANILLDGTKLADLNLSPLRVTEKLASMNTFIPAGDINIGPTNYLLHTDAMFKDLAEVNKFYLRSRNGKTVTIGDVGKAEDGSAIQTNIVKVNGKKQVYVPIYRQLGANSLDVVDDVRASLKVLESSLQGFKLELVSDQTMFIRKAIDSIAMEGLIGGGLAALMILLFLGSGRATVAVLLTLPVSIVGSIAVLKALGCTLNVMTLGGLALSVGVLVDNGIVVIEVIMGKIASGMSRRDAALRGAKEVAMPVLASTIATLVVFVPAVFLRGNLATLFDALALSVIAAMGISYFAAMILVPLYAANFLGKISMDTKGILGTMQAWLDKVTRSYGRTLHWTLKRSRFILNVSLVLHAAVAIGLFSYVGYELFPKADAGSLTLNLRGSPGSTITKTADLASEIDKALHEIIEPGDLNMTLINAGVFPGYSAAFSKNSGMQDAFIDVELTDSRQHSSQYYAKLIRARLKEHFSDVKFSIELGGLLSAALNGGSRSPMDIQVRGIETQKAKAIADALLPKIKAIDGATDVNIQQVFDYPVMDLKINRKKVSDLGLTPEIVVKNLVSAVANSVSYDEQIWVDPKTGVDYLLGVQFPEGSIASERDLLKIPVVSPDQDRSVPLSKIVTVSHSQSAIELNHNNLQPTIDIYLDAEGRDIGHVSADVQKILDTTPLPAGYVAQIQGEISEMRSSARALSWGFLLAASLVYLILVAQFRSWLMPAIIMTNVPKGIVGVMIMLALTNTYFSIQAAIGCIFVIGVSVSHSVLLLEFILERVKHHDTLEDGIVEASMARLRPITMTSLASILGLLPMAIGIGHGAEANIPLGRAVIGGQLLSTFLNFYLLPCLYHRLAPRQKKDEAEVLPPVVLQGPEEKLKLSA